MPLLDAAVAWYKRRYGVQLHVQREALSLVGSQEGLAHLLMAVADPGDGILMGDVSACTRACTRAAIEWPAVT